MYKILIGLLMVKSLFSTDPIVQTPTNTSVNIVWFTDDPGETHYVEYGNALLKRALCKTTQLSRMREDSEQSWVFQPVYRHEAVLEGLTPHEKTAYRTVSINVEGNSTKSEIFQCSSAPKKGSSLKILFTSDHQGKPMVAANLQKVKEVVPEIDAIFFAGDCVDHADKASEWFGENGFFACLQGKAKKQLNSGMYAGGALLQSAPMFCTIGNHEVMGRWSDQKSLDEQFNDPYPRLFAQRDKDSSFNTDSYEEIFTLPESIPGGKKYYAVTFGDIRLVVLHATRIWRKPGLGLKGKYTESEKNFDQPLDWGFGDFIFEPIEKGTAQYLWLESEFQSSEFQDAKYKIVMLHNPLHSLGENSIPPFTNPVQQIERDAERNILSIRYDYPREQDYLIRDIEPLLVEYGVDLVLCGHTHVWNRFRSPEGIHHLETSNVGNTYGAYLDIPRDLVPGKGDDNYRAFGDPNGLTPILPTIAPLNNLPYISSQEITVFSIFSTDTGAVDSYYFDTRQPDSSVVHFDRFYVSKPKWELSQSIKDLPKYPLPDLIVFDIDNTLIESSRQIALDPSTNGYLRKKFPNNSEEIIKGIQSSVPWQLCESETADVVRYFQQNGVKVIAVTKKSSDIRESVYKQLVDNGIDLQSIAFLTLESGTYYRGVLHAESDKGVALKHLLQELNWEWKDRLIYFVDDRKSHLEDYSKAFQSEAAIGLFEYIYSHNQKVDESVLDLQLQDFLSGKPIREDLCLQ